MAKKSAKKTTKATGKPARKPQQTKPSRPVAKMSAGGAKKSAARPAATAGRASAPVAAAAGKTTKKAARPTAAVGTPARKSTPAARPQIASRMSTDRQPRVIAPPQPGVPTNEKPKRNQAGLGKRDLEHFRQLLLQKRAELVGDMSQMEREALRSATGSNLSNLPVHMADMGTDNYEQEFTLGLVEKDRQLLREINQALAKIQDGTYGICEGTGKPISRPRLEAQPWARHSIEYAREMERGRLR